MLEIVFLIPFLTGAAAFFLPATIGRGLLVLTGAGHLVLSVMVWAGRLTPMVPDYFAVTPEGLLSLLVISLLFFLISIYTISYLKASDIQRETIFIGSMLLFLSTMTMVTLSDHIMVMWIAIEATTLASAPLIYTHRSAATLEATFWGEDELYLFMEASGMRSANVEKLPSYPSQSPRKELDFILYGSGVEIVDFQIPRVCYSDHLPLVCDFRISGCEERAA